MISKWIIGVSNFGGLINFWKEKKKKASVITDSLYCRLAVQKKYEDRKTCSYLILIV